MIILPITLLNCMVKLLMTWRFVDLTLEKNPCYMSLMGREFEKEGNYHVLCWLQRVSYPLVCLIRQYTYVPSGNSHPPMQRSNHD